MPNKFVEFHKGMTVCSTNGFQGLKPKSTFQNERFLGLASSFKSPQIKRFTQSTAPSKERKKTNLLVDLVALKSNFPPGPDPGLGHLGFQGRLT